MNEKTQLSEMVEASIGILMLLIIGSWFCISAGVITFDTPNETITAPIETITVTITPQSTVIISTPEPTAQPTPDQISEYAPGERTMGEIFSWRRDDVQGLKDMKISTVTYGYKILPKYSWFSEQYYQYFEEYPQPENKFIVVYIAQWEDGIVQNDDPSVWGFNQSRYAIQYRGEVYRADQTYQPFIRIKEMEEIPDYGKVNRIKPYGYDLTYTSNSAGRVNAGWMAFERQWLRMGFSNRWDGYILIQVPKDAKPEELMLIGDFGNFGSAQWRLVLR